MELQALVEAAKKAIGDDGFFEFQSPEIGRSILEIDEDNFPFFTEKGLRFYQEQVHRDKVSLIRIVQNDPNFSSALPKS